MTDNSMEPEVLQQVWSADDELDSGPDVDCSPTRVCRNARDFSFDGIAEDGADLATAWRELLEREGKMSPSGESVRDLVLGRETGD